MEVEIGREDIQAAFVAFSLGTWSRAVSRARKAPVEASMLDARYVPTQLCTAAAGRYIAFLGIEDGDVDEEGMRMVKLALGERDRMRIGPRRAPSEHGRTAAWNVAEPHPVDSRVVWRHVLEGGGVPDRLGHAVLAYFGCLHGTGCVERGQGRDKRAVVEPQLWSLRPSAQIEEENSKCLELRRGRPKARAIHVSPVC